MSSKNTIMFEGFKDSQLDKKEALVEIYTALTDRGYNAVDQIVGYLTSGDPSYITSHNNARSLILRVDRDDLLEEILTSYLGSDKAYVGVMAQEVEQVMPEAVSRGSDGYLRVSYDKLGLKFRTYRDWLAGGARIPSEVTP